MFTTICSISYKRKIHTGKSGEIYMGSKNGYDMPEIVGKKGLKKLSVRKLTQAARKPRWFMVKNRLTEAIKR